MKQLVGSAIEQATTAADKKCIGTEKERILVALGGHVGHDETCVVLGVPGGLHAADA